MTQYFPSIAHEVAERALARVPMDRRVLDQEHVMVESGGRRDFPSVAS